MSCWKGCEGNFVDIAVEVDGNCIMKNAHQVSQQPNSIFKFTLRFFLSAEAHVLHTVLQLRKAGFLSSQKKAVG
jgi:hypothetical protein